jgi:iron(III) transport system ATP-binding protein
MIRYMVNVAGQTLLVDELHTKGSGRREQGEPVRLRVRHREAVLIRG